MCGPVVSGMGCPATAPLLELTAGPVVTVDEEEAETVVAIDIEVNSDVLFGCSSPLCDVVSAPHRTIADDSLVAANSQLDALAVGFGMSSLDSETNANHFGSFGPDSRSASLRLVDESAKRSTDGRNTDFDIVVVVVVAVDVVGDDCVVVVVVVVVIDD